MVTRTIYGPGGFDPALPNGNVIEQYEVEEPEPSPEELARQSAVAKLQALGLTEAEALALVGGAP
jgi:hypothetical protein